MYRSLNCWTSSGRMQGTVGVESTGGEGEGFGRRGTCMHMSGGARRAGFLSQGRASRAGSMCEGAAVASTSMSVVVLVSVPHYRWR